MEDIEDLLAGSGGGVAPGFRLPVAAAVGVNTKQQRKKITQSIPKITSNVPGTQVRVCIYIYEFVSYGFIKFFSLPLFADCISLLQTIYIKTFGCSHNQVIFVCPSFFPGI